MRAVKFILMLTVISLLFVAVRPVNCAVTLVQKAKSPPQFATDSGRTSSAATFPVQPIAGDLLVAIVASDYGTLTAPSGWATAANHASLDNTTLVPALAVFYKIAVVGELLTVTSPESRSLEIYEYSGIDQATPLLGVGAGAGTAGTSLGSGTFTPSTLPALLIAAFIARPGLADPLVRNGSGNAVLGAFNNSFTVQESISAGEVPCDDIDPACYAFASADRVVAASATYSANVPYSVQGTSGTAVGWRGQIAAFKAAGASPTPTASPTSTPTLSGTVTYGNAIGVPNPRFVSNVLLTGAGSPNVFATTAGPGTLAGQYILTGFGVGSYTVTPAKTTGQNGITSFDAGRISQHVAGTVPLTGNQLIVADVSGNGMITSFDAGEVARYVAGGSTQIGSSGGWIFLPVNRNYPSVTTSMTAQDYIALLMGEVSGNWSNTGARPARNGPERNPAVTAPQLVAPAGGEVVVPVTIRGATDEGINAYQFDLRYDAKVLQPRSNPVDLAGTASSKLAVVANAEEAGLLRVVVYGATPIEADGILLNLRFTAIGAPGSASPLMWQRCLFNDDDEADMIDGRIEVSEPTATTADQ